MLSMSNVSNSKAAAGYYSKEENYYLDGSGEGVWFGKGSDALGLSGDVKYDEFVALLDGRLPNGHIIHNGANGHRGGVDCTFSAPKSVSLMSILGDDKRVRCAHEVAVTRALRIAETFAGYRVTEQGETRHEKSDNLIVARFNHYLSRSYDPQLHTHCIVLNATQRTDGSWRALDNEQLYRSKMMLGAIYRSELARELREIGYDIRVTHSDGRFELAGFDMEILKQFSQRAQAMDEWLAKTSGDASRQFTALERKQAALATRKAKAATDIDELHIIWGERLHSIGIMMPNNPLGPSAKMNMQQAAEDSIGKAVAHLSERESAFRRDQVIRFALQFGMGECDYESVVVALDGALAKGSLITNGELVTTNELKEVEARILRTEANQRNALPLKASAFQFASFFGNLSPEQIHVVQQTVESQSRFIGVQGRAGTGKTTTLTAVVKILQAHGVKTFGVAPSSNASQILSEAEMETTTVSNFLARRMFSKVSGDGVLIVDEASMLSTLQAKSLIDSAMCHDFRIVFVGDTGQLDAVAAGKPFAQLLKSGMPVSTLRTIHRQKDHLLRRAVMFAADGDTAQAVKSIEQSIIEVREKESRLEKIASAFRELPRQDQDQTLVVAGTRTSREQLNRLIRQSLHIGKNFPSTTALTLDRKDLTVQETASISSYEPGDVVISNRKYASLGLNKGGIARVVRVNMASVDLQTEDGKLIEWHPALAKDVSVFKLVDREVCVTDRIRVTRNVHEHGLINGDRLRVIAVDDTSRTYTVELENGTTKKLNAASPFPLDYDYCRTIHAAQGATCDRVFVEADTNSLTANRSSFYVAISRARTEVRVFTNDKSNFGLVMDRVFEKTSALDVGDSVFDNLEVE